MKALENLFRYKRFEVSGTSCISVKAPYQSTSRIKKSDAYKTRQSVPMQLFANIWTIQSGNVWRLNRFFFCSEEFDNFSTRHLVLVFCFFLLLKEKARIARAVKKNKKIKILVVGCVFFRFDEWWLVDVRISLSLSVVYTGGAWTRRMLGTVETVYLKTG